jgi:hypothetical protein
MQADTDRQTDDRQAERPNRTRAEAEQKGHGKCAFWRRLRRGVDEIGKSLTNENSLRLKLILLYAYPHFSTPPGYFKLTLHGITLILTHYNKYSIIIY